MIEILSIDDLDWINAIHQKAFNKMLTKNDLENPYNVIGIKNICYLIYTKVLDEAEIIYIAVDDNHRNKGYAKNMIKAIDAKIFLDVNENNMPAINLYRNCGFYEYARRKNYYDGADAILMKYERK